MKKFFDEFKQFALKGNVMDLAVGVIIGAAFQDIVKSLTDNFINPLISLCTGGNSEDGLSLGGTFKINGVVFNYGAFLSAVINFLIMAFILFILLKSINKLMTVGKKKEEVAPTTKKCPMCLTEIPLDAKRCSSCTTVFDEEFQKFLNENSK